ncbi:MAG: GAF domain-containing protein [Actinomycetota bacterium]|nr:GAF domain-containing protein [Actinomycetota bacterium]MDQ6946255.1 GAF domain-containing protein [Actinomycetota bacterium]
MTVGRERWLRMSRALASGHPAASGLCSKCVETLSVAAAGITIISDAGAQVSLCASGATVTALAELEFTLGNGPASDAHEHGVPVCEVDLVNAPPLRWSAFASPVVDAGFRAVFAFPLRLGAARLGALILYQIHPGDLDADSYADALTGAEVITRAILARQAGMPEEELMAELADGGAFHAEVHQASGWSRCSSASASPTP